ncbi:PLP-dependent aminotransferase family protein [Coralliovum pocilloporae]|uniref:MocR-like pyridoxine biosynthesis transcription factor PdxR n=1 Tax=Coralliovum pocilloporae TaxID=3066369 RepID=UPI003307182F
MRDFIFSLDPDSKKGLQSQIREFLVSAILNGHLKPNERVPSSRKLSEMLGVSRNTVMLAYQYLIDDGYLVTHERSGYFVSEQVLEGNLKPLPVDQAFESDPVDWTGRFRVTPSHQRNILKPDNWTEYPYPFIYGQVDHKLFPITDWRECVYRVLGKRWLEAWTMDTLDADDSMLIEQIRQRILPRRGILADEDEILVTLGAQHALYLTSSLLISSKTNVALEDPSYPDVRNIVRLRTDNIRFLGVDDFGLPVDDRLSGSDVCFVTPSHQSPTTVTMPHERRLELLKAARQHDFLIVEDDYEFETNYMGSPCPALKSLDQDGRVIYVGSFSKSLFPGLRLGFIVGSKAFIKEARALRRLMMRHPPNNNQRSTAFFLSLGYYDAFVRRLHRVYRGRWQEMGEALSRHLPEWSQRPSFGGSSYWVEGPEGLDADELAQEALNHGIVIAPGGIYFSGPNKPKNCFLLGFSSIDQTMIEPGIKKLAELIHSRTG